MCRLLAKHVKLALKLGFGFILAFLAIMSILGEAGSDSQAMSIYAGGPKMAERRGIVGSLVHGLASLLGPFTLLFCMLFSSVWRFYLTHPTPFNLALFGLYLVWLWVAVRTILEDEYTDDDKSKWALRSVAVIGAWAAAVAAAKWGIHWLFVDIGS